MPQGNFYIVKLWTQPKCGVKINAQLQQCSPATIILVKLDSGSGVLVSLSPGVKGEIKGQHYQTQH